MAAGAELRMTGERNGDSTEHEGSGYQNQENRDARLPAHAPIEHVVEIAS
jgi:hypothetical protein